MTTKLQARRMKSRNAPRYQSAVARAEARAQERARIRYENDPSAEDLVNEAIRKREAALRKAGR